MFYQVDPKIKKEQRDDECYLFAILDIHEKVGKHKITYEQYDKIWRLLVRMGYLQRDGLVIDIPGIAQIASAVTLHHVFMQKVIEFEQYTHLIARYYRELPDGRPMTHFVGVDMKEPHNITYDPYSPAGAQTVKYGKRTGYRYIFAEAI